MISIFHQLSSIRHSLFAIPLAINAGNCSTCGDSFNS